MHMLLNTKVNSSFGQIFLYKCIETHGFSYVIARGGAWPYVRYIIAQSQTSKLRFFQYAPKTATAETHEFR